MSRRSVSRIAGLLLLASGGYLFYYWPRLRFGDTATVADDPIVSFGVRFSGGAGTELLEPRCSTGGRVYLPVLSLRLTRRLDQRQSASSATPAAVRASLRPR
jgi:hypothetical protein